MVLSLYPKKKWILCLLKRRQAVEIHFNSLYFLDTTPDSSGVNDPEVRAPIETALLYLPRRVVCTTQGPGHPIQAEQNNNTSFYIPAHSQHLSRRFLFVFPEVWHRPTSVLSDLSIPKTYNRLTLSVAPLRPWSSASTMSSPTIPILPPGIPTAGHLLTGLVVGELVCLV